MINTLEDAYRSIADEIIGFVNGRPWEVAGAQFEVRKHSIGLRMWLEVDKVKDGKGDFTLDGVFDSARFLGDETERMSGQRVWGFEFRLYPTGKFEIDYDYNKPEGYEETDETISGDEINASLNQLLSKDDGSKNQ